MESIFLLSLMTIIQLLKDSPCEHLNVGKKIVFLMRYHKKEIWEGFDHVLFYILVSCCW